MKESIELGVGTGKSKAIIISPKQPDVNLHKSPASQAWGALVPPLGKWQLREDSHTPPISRRARAIDLYGISEGS